MGERSNASIDDGRAGSGRTEFHADPSEGQPAAPSTHTHRLVPDGGEAEETGDGSESEDASSEEAEEESDAQEEVEESNVEEESEAETEAEEESEEESDAEAESEEESDAQEEDDEETEAEENGEVEDEAGLVYLDLQGLFLDVLGLEVDLNEIVLDVSARPGSNRLLGNLLSSVSGLLDGGPSSILGSLGGGLSSGLNRAVGAVKTALTTVVPFVGGGDGDGAEADEEGEGEGEGEGGIFPSITGWIAGGVTRVIAALPLEELIAKIVRTTLEVLLERTEAEPSDVPGVDEDQAQPAESGAQAEAES